MNVNEMLEKKDTVIYDGKLKSSKTWKEYVLSMIQKYEIYKLSAAAG